MHMPPQCPRGIWQGKRRQSGVEEHRFRHLSTPRCLLSEGPTLTHGLEDRVERISTLQLLAPEPAPCPPPLRPPRSGPGIAFNPTLKGHHFCAVPVGAMYKRGGAGCRFGKVQDVHSSHCFAEMKPCVRVGPSESRHLGVLK